MCVMQKPSLPSRAARDWTFLGDLLERQEVHPVNPVNPVKYS
jgi:hypothetical protein